MKRLRRLWMEARWRASLVWRIVRGRSVIYRIGFDAPTSMVVEDSLTLQDCNFRGGVQITNLSSGMVMRVGGYGAGYAEMSPEEVERRTKQLREWMQS